MSLTPPYRLQKLQAALHAKAKASPDQRFHALYDKVYRLDVLLHGYECCKANRGAAGVDGQTFEDIEAYGLEQWLGELAQRLKDGTYRPDPVRRVWIPKPDGKKRPLGIPTLKDRVVQTAATLVLEPIFEADLQPEQYAYRKERSALDADLSGYFDTIPHAELMQCLRRRIVDGAMLRLLKMWLEMPVEELDERGHRQRTTRNRDEGKGTPQGAPISPLLANLYMRRFVLGWKQVGYARWLDAHIVNYADDFVICCRGTAEKDMTVMRELMSKVKLTVNETKTHIRQVPEETFDFLGYTFGRHWTHKSRRFLLCGAPSKKKVKLICEKISKITSRRRSNRHPDEIAEDLNRALHGWANYFCMGPVTDAYRAVNAHTRYRFRRWWGAKHKKARFGPTWYWSPWLEKTFGILQLKWDPSRLPKARKPAHLPHAQA